MIMGTKLCSTSDSVIHHHRPSDAERHWIRFTTDFPISRPPTVYVCHLRKGKYHNKIGCFGANIGIPLEMAAIQKRMQCPKCWANGHIL